MTASVRNALAAATRRLIIAEGGTTTSHFAFPTPRFIQKMSSAEAEDIFVSYWDYSLGPASTRALPASLPVYLTKFLMNRPARSLALVSHSDTSA